MPPRGGCRGRCVPFPSLDRCSHESNRLVQAVVTRTLIHLRGFGCQGREFRIGLCHRVLSASCSMLSIRSVPRAFFPHRSKTPSSGLRTEHSQCTARFLRSAILSEGLTSSSESSSRLTCACDISLIGLSSFLINLASREISLICLPSLANALFWYGCGLSISPSFTSALCTQDAGVDVIDRAPRCTQLLMGTGMRRGNYEANLERFCWSGVRDRHRDCFNNAECVP